MKEECKFSPQRAQAKIRRSSCSEEKSRRILERMQGEITITELQPFIMSINGFRVYGSHEGTIRDNLGSGSLAL